MKNFLTRYGYWLTILTTGLVFLFLATTRAEEPQEKPTIALVVNNYLCNERAIMRVVQALTANREKVLKTGEELVATNDCVVGPLVHFRAVATLVGPIADFDGDEFYVYEIGSAVQPPPDRRYVIGRPGINVIPNGDGA